MSNNSYDYPPTFVEHRPANYGSIAHLNRVELGRLRHHFFASRLAAALRMVVDTNRQITAYHRSGFQAVIEHVLISHGYCATFGIEVPASYHLQSLLGNFYPDPNFFCWDSLRDKDEGLRAAISADEETNADGHRWAEAMTEGVGCWWRNNDGDVLTLPSFSDLDTMFFKKIRKLVDSKVLSGAAEITEADIGIIICLDQLDPPANPSSPTSIPTDVPMEAPITANLPSSTTTSPDVPMAAPLSKESLPLPIINNPMAAHPDNANLSTLRDRILILEQRIKMLQSHEAEIVERRSYNVDLCACLHKLSNRLDKIPFRSTGLDVPTGISRKGKETQMHSEASPNSQFDGGWAARVMHLDGGEIDSSTSPLDPISMSDWVVRFDDLFAEVLPGLFGPAAESHQCTYRILLKDFLRDQFLQLSIEDAIEALQEPNSAVDVPEMASRYQGLEDRPPPDIAASILDPAMYIEERRRLLAQFAHRATHLTPDNHATHCGLSTGNQPISGTTPPHGLSVVVPSPARLIYATIPTQTSPTSSESDSNPPSNSDSEAMYAEHSHESEEGDNSEESDAIEYDEEAGYGVSTTLP